jgi:glycosyltransferase involved in cell wall biosynthesis
MVIELNTRISVCMATYNGSRFIRQQLDSILVQLAPEDQVVISDDSSTDDTVAIINEYTDQRIRLLEGNRFRNPIFNFENALLHATGDVIALSDQDDEWLPGKLELIRREFAANPNPVYLVVLDADIVDEAGALIHESVFRKFRRVGPGLAGNIFDNSYLGCCMVFSRELLKYALPFPRRIPMHDIWLGLVAEIFGKTRFIHVKTMHYRKHGSSMTDFGIKFIPWTQVKRRWALGSALLNRWIERSFQG